MKLKELVSSGVLGQITHISGQEQLRREHGAAFMRRFQRHSRNCGGLLNHKCCHDLDIMLWVIGHEHRLTKVASFGGNDVFTPDKQPAERCSECPAEIHEACHYKAIPGFVFPVEGKSAIYHQNEGVYGGDLCVYSADKDIVDNQTVIG